MATSASHRDHFRENLELFSVIWSDRSPIKPEIRDQLKSIVDYLFVFDNEQSCLKHIHQQSKSSRIILITSGQHGRIIVPQIVDVPQVTAIYIFCFDLKANREWSKHYSQVKDVVVRLYDIVQRIQDEYALQQRTNFDQPLLFRYFRSKIDAATDKMTIDEHNKFLQDQSLIDCLIRMGSSPIKKQAMKAFCENYYRNNPFELSNIDKFSREYSPESTLHWYKKSDFTYRLLNKALYTRDVDLLILLQFFIHDLGRQLAKNRCSSPIRVYRNLWLRKDEIQLMENSVDDFISINTFLSTSDQESHAQGLLQTSPKYGTMERVILEIDADPTLVGSRPFGEVNIQDRLSSLKNQFIFMVGSIFRLTNIKQSEDGVWHVQLVLSSINEKNLKPLFNLLQRQFDHGPITDLQLGYFLKDINIFNSAGKAFRRHANQLQPNDPELIDCYRAFGFIARVNKDWSLSLRWYDMCINLSSEMKSIDPSKKVETYQDMGHTYQDKGDYSNAKKFYEKALASARKSLGDQHPLVIMCLTNIGDVYRREKNYKEAERNYEHALKLADKVTSFDHSKRAMILRGIARTREDMGDIDRAKRYFQKACTELEGDPYHDELLLSQIQKDLGRVSHGKKGGG